MTGVQTCALPISLALGGQSDRQVDRNGRFTYPPLATGDPDDLGGPLFVHELSATP